MEFSRPVVALMGPTAVGKTELSLALAERWDAEIVSVDSMQVYRGMDIGTAKPSLEERRRVPHHVMDFLPPTETFSAGRFRDAATEAITDIARRGRRALLVGGTGLYLRALSRGLCNAPSADRRVRADLEQEAKRRGSPALHERLGKLDPDAAGRIGPGDLRRIVRALEVHALTGRSLSEMQRDDTVAAPFPIATFALSREREDLYDRINRRVDEMMEAGLVEEVGRLVRSHDLAPGPRQALGYKEIIAYLDGDVSLDQATEAIKTRTRRYAKRQLTWFRADPAVSWVHLGFGEPALGAVAIIEGQLAKL